MAMKYFPLGDSSDFVRRLRRSIDGNISYRKLFVALVIFTIMFLYSGPKVFRWMFSSETAKEPLSRCMDERLTPFYQPALEYDVNIRHQPPFPHELDVVPFVGNGYFGAEISKDAKMYIKGRRGLQVPLHFHPLVSVRESSESLDVDPGVFGQESTVVEYQTGIVHRFQCNARNEFFVAYQYYAHRNIPYVFVQEIKITNLRKQSLELNLLQPRVTDWPTAVSRKINLQHGSVIQEYNAVTGSVEIPGTDKVRVVSIIYRNLGATVSVKKRATSNLQLLTTIAYSDPVNRVDLEKGTLKVDIEKKAVTAIEKALQEAVHEERQKYYEFRRQHVRVWSSLWQTGFRISTSKAEGAVNGDRINATIYAVLSQVRAYEFEESVTPQRANDIRQALTYADSCYDSYHTLEADNLWREMNSVAAMNNVVNSWLLTLEKHGCHNLIKAGASGVVQAMVLSLGSFRFTNQHLEWRIHPKYLHRDFMFRRLNYGDMTHVNITVEVTEDNKAVIYAALDRSDGQYYACDAGCLHEPVQLSETVRQFPVMLTEPLTAILYITSDQEHVQELKHAIHVKEVIEAPAHEHHVILLHKHGHSLGLPALFWVSVCAIIVIFHIFLCKLIANEYLHPPEKMRYRYSKP